MMSPDPAGVTIALMAPVPRPWLDWAIAAVVTALAVPLAIGPGDPNGSAFIAAVTLPLIWRRTAPLAAAAALAAGFVISALPTLSEWRCGVAIPVALAIAFSVAARRDRRDALIGLALLLAGLVVLLFTDPLLDAGALFVLPLCAGVWWAGRLVRSRSRLAAELTERSRQLAQTREATARLAVEVDRARIATDLEAAARRPLQAIVALADSGLAQEPDQARTTFASIERQGRESLEDMRVMLGRLRGSGLETAPQPTLADLEGLVGAGVELRTSGERRALPAGIELAGYRMIQHALEALAAHEPATIEIALRFTDDALELEIRGRMAGGNAAEAALAAARERVTAHGGRFSRERRADGGCVLRSRIPVAASHRDDTPPAHARSAAGPIPARSSVTGERTTRGRRPPPASG
jgi:signal transduction histidine kinase